MLSDPAELELCPVMALTTHDAYVRRKALHHSCFIVSLRANGNPVSKDTISAWVVKLLCRAYLRATELDACLAATSVHEICAVAVAVSLMIQATFALFDVLRAAT